MDFLDFIRVVINCDLVGVSRLLKENPAFATFSEEIGASRQISQKYFFSEVSHYLYAGDTALHMAAAAFRPAMVALLIDRGANCRAKNRRGAEPLHYAADGRTDSDDQAKVIELLILSGADPNAVDKSGVTPLQRAVRRRSLGGVRALLDGGAKVRQRNNSGSTPLHLAVQNTGASGSGTEEAHRQQPSIIELLIERGAEPADIDSKGKSAEQAATSGWIRDLLVKKSGN